MHGKVASHQLGQRAAQANSSSAAESKSAEEQTPLLEASALQPSGNVAAMEAVVKPERKLKETRTFNPRKMRPKRSGSH